MLALCVSWVCVVNPVCLAVSCQQTAMATGEESKSPFELDSVKLRSLYKDGADLVEDRRAELVSWFDRYTITKPAVVFDKDGFKVGDTDVFWDDLAAEWKHGRDAVFTLLGVEVADKALAWNRLIDLLRPGTSPPCPLCCLLLLSSHHSGLLVLLEQPESRSLVVSGFGVWCLLLALSPLITHPQRPVLCVVGCCGHPNCSSLTGLFRCRVIGLVSFRRCSCVHVLHPPFISFTLQSSFRLAWFVLPCPDLSVVFLC